MEKKIRNEKPNIVDSCKGRKWTWGRLKGYGEFSAIDFSIFFFVIVINLLLFIFVAWWVVLLILFFSLGLTFILTKEWEGIKSHELIIEIYKYAFRDKKSSLIEIMDEEVYNE